MIELLRNSSDYITHSVSVAGTPVAADIITLVVINPETGASFTPNAIEITGVGEYRARLPFAATQFDANLKAYWSYSVAGESVVAEEDIEVVTPYITVKEIRAAHPELAAKTDAELRDMERKVRAIINKVTGQEFGVRKTTVTLTGTENFALSNRLYHVHYYTVNGVAGSLSELSVLNGGWTVQVTYPPGAYQVKSDTYLRRGGAMTVVLHGNFGWPSVPGDINLAAKMLIGDYYCNDAVYRQRGVQAVRAADWRLDFHNKAFEGTGNIDVDLLLSKYSGFNMVII